MIFLRKIYAAAAALGFAATASAIEIHVSPAGNDSNPGTREAPVATLRAAQQCVRHYKSIWHQPETITVVIAAGNYELDEPLVFNGLDSGDPDHPVVWQAAPGARVSLCGGVNIPGSAFGRVKDPAIRRRLNPKAASHIVCADLRALGIDSFGEIVQYGHSASVPVAPLELFFDGEPMELARYPNEGWIRIGEVLDPGSSPRVGDYSDRPGVFRYTDDRHAAWAGLKDVWLQGTFNYGFADDNIRVASIDPGKGTVTLASPHLYGIASGAAYQHYFAYNILEELDRPSEWYLDRESGILYFYPPSDIRKANIQVSILEDPIVCLEGVEYLRLERLTIECGRGIGVYIERSNHNVIAGCTIRNVGTSGVFMGQGAEQTFPHITVDDYEGRPVSRRIGNLQGHIYKYPHWDRKAGMHNGILSCDIYNTGSGAVYLSGGDKVSLTPRQQLCGELPDDQLQPPEQVPVGGGQRERVRQPGFALRDPRLRLAGNLRLRQRAPVRVQLHPRRDAQLERHLAVVYRPRSEQPREHRALQPLRAVRKSRADEHGNLLRRQLDGRAGLRQPVRGHEHDPRRDVLQHGLGPEVREQHRGESRRLDDVHFVALLYLGP